MAVLFTLAVASAKPDVLLSSEYHGNYAPAALAALGLQHQLPVAPGLINAPELINAPIDSHLPVPAEDPLAYSLPLSNAYSNEFFYGPQRLLR